MLSPRGSYQSDRCQVACRTPQLYGLKQTFIVALALPALHVHCCLSRGYWETLWPAGCASVQTRGMHVRVQQHACLLPLYYYCRCLAGRLGSCSACVGDLACLRCSEASHVAPCCQFAGRLLYASMYVCALLRT